MLHLIEVDNTDQMDGNHWKDVMRETKRGVEKLVQMIHIILRIKSHDKKPKRNSCFKIDFLSMKILFPPFDDPKTRMMIAPNFFPCEKHFSFAHVCSCKTQFVFFFSI